MESAGVARAIPQRGLPEIEEGKLLGISVELIKGKWQYVFKYLAAEGKPFSDVVAGVRHG
jgi:hypothetical protein